MVFSGIPFLFFFLPLCLAVYYAVPQRCKNAVLLIFSLVFYAWGEPVYILLMLFVSFSDFCIGRCMERHGSAPSVRRAWMLLSVVIDLSLLGLFKYADFAVRSVNAVLRWLPWQTGVGISLPEPGIALPIGISFFTFQSLSYIFDLYRGTVRAERSYADYLTYISMFPQLIAGPIVRYSTISEELHARQIRREDISEGSRRFAFGLFKKVLIANRIGLLFDTVQQTVLTDPSGVSAVSAWLGAAAFTLQLYFDFSGYSDMAIGLGRLLGFRFEENFRYPLSAVSITDFWRRWHISLSGWFRDYVYIPLGGNRGGGRRTVRNLLIVWLLTGLWHGTSWNFVAWGLWHFCFLVLEKNVWGAALERLSRVLRHLYALLVIVVGFVIFAIPERAALTAFLSAMFANGSLAGADVLWLARNYGAVFGTAFMLAFPVYPALAGRLSRLESSQEASLQSLLSIAGYAALFLLTVAYLVSDSYNPFLYFRF